MKYMYVYVYIGWFMIKFVTLPAHSVTTPLSIQHGYDNSHFTCM